MTNKAPLIMTKAGIENCLSVFNDNSKYHLRLAISVFTKKLPLIWHAMIPIIAIAFKAS